MSAIDPAPRRIRHTLTLTLGWVVAAIALVVIVFLAWTQTVMQGERPAALAAWQNDGLTISSDATRIVLEPAQPTGDGLVFIPGARVDPYAYLYKLSGIVEEGTTVVITKPTLNLAFFDTRPLSVFTDGVDGVETWFVGGHSLGGVRACQLAADLDVAGLALFGSYCANDLSQSGLAVLSISAENDGLSTPQKITDAAPLLPVDARFVQLQGANHASFGDYGPQPGDGEATASSADVRDAITSAWTTFLGIAAVAP